MNAIINIMLALWVMLTIGGIYIAVHDAKISYKQYGAFTALYEFAWVATMVIAVSGLTVAYGWLLLTQPTWVTAEGLFTAIAAIVGIFAVLYTGIITMPDVCEWQREMQKRRKAQAALNRCRLPKI